MNNLDKSYTDLLQDILDNGVQKGDRTGTGTISVFGRQIRHKMSGGFPLITTKKIHWNSIVAELLWFLQGRTDLRYLLENNCHIWDGDCYKFYTKWWEESDGSCNLTEEQSNKWLKLVDGGLQWAPLSQEEFINKIKTDDEFAKKWGELGKIYGKQWRSWGYDSDKWREEYKNLRFGSKEEIEHLGKKGIDQIANLINDLKTNPDSRRLMVNSWNVSEISQMLLPPCHYGFQVYTRELNRLERIQLGLKAGWEPKGHIENFEHEDLNGWNIPTRAISLMFNMRSIDTFLGLPFNIASYGLLLMMIADEVNMVPDELIGNLGDTHLYLNHIEQAKEQIGRELTLEERRDLVSPEMFSQIYTAGDSSTLSHSEIDLWCIPRRTREPFELPTVHVRDGIFCSSTNDVILENYKSHPTIKAPLSN
jgi:thymidylate synthase